MLKDQPARRDVARRGTRPRFGRSRRGVLAAGVLLLAACGSDEPSSSPSSAAPSSTAAPSTAASSVAPASSTQQTAAPSTDGSDAPAPTDATAATVQLVDGCDEVVIGAILSQNGPASQLGEETGIAVEAFAKTHTEILGKPLKVQIENDRSDATAAAEAAQRLTSDKCVVGIVGPNLTGSRLAAFPFVTAAKIPWILFTPTPYEGYNEQPYVFSPNIPPIPMQLQDFTAYFEALGAKNPVAITSDDATGDAIEKIWGAAGFKVVRVPLAVTDYEPQLASLKSDGHDALAYVGSGGQPPGHIARGLDALGWDVPLLTAPSNLTTDLVNIAGAAADGVRGFIWPAGAGPDYFADNAEQRAAVQELYDAVGADVEYGLQPNIGYGWDAMKSLFLAMEECGCADREGIQKVLDGQEYWGANGRVKRVPVGQPGADHAGVQPESAMRAVIRDGELVPDES